MGILIDITTFLIAIFSLKFGVKAILNPDKVRDEYVSSIVEKKGISNPSFRGKILLKISKEEWYLVNIKVGGYAMVFMGLICFYASIRGFAETSHKLVAPKEIRK